MVFCTESISKIDPDRVTLHSYELGIEAYISMTPNVVGSSFKTWIDDVLALISKEASILEIGSGSGRDARYMESHGFKVERTDATKGFILKLKREGYTAQFLNILTDELDKPYHLIFANAVFLHFTRNQLKSVLEKIHRNLIIGGILAFSVKKGTGEEWSTTKLGFPRYFCYWQADSIGVLLQSTGFHTIQVTEDNRFLQIIALRRGATDDIGNGFDAN